MDRVLITGITGFVGPHLASRLLDLDCEVFGLARQRAGEAKPKRLEELGIFDRLKLLHGDITDLTSILNALDNSQPDTIFHLAAQSYVPRSFSHPLETTTVNSLGTQCLLEAVRLKDLDPRIVFAGSSEEYGLQIASKAHFDEALKKYKVIYPKPSRIPELPVDEENPLRPMSPYAVSKLQGDYLMRAFFYAYGLRCIVSRGFNHEGAGRGGQFVTSSIVRQCVKLKYGETPEILTGNINVFRDWSSVGDVIEGYIILGTKGRPGEVYVQGSMRTNSVLSYLLLTLDQLGYGVREVKTLKGTKRVKNPAEVDSSKIFDTEFQKTKIDQLLLRGELEYEASDGGLAIDTTKGRVKVKFDPVRYRPAEVPILMSNNTKIRRLGFRTRSSLGDIIRDQTNHYLKPESRSIE